MPKRFVGALGIVEPLYGRAGNAELRRVKEQLGLVGISIHTRFQGVSTDSPLVMDQLAPNLIFDTSLAYTIQPALRLMERFGHHRVSFGTDLYSHPLGYKRSTVLDQLLDAELPKDALQDVLAGTAERLLGLGPIRQAAP